MKKIVSLLAAATEIVCALGLEDQLVGRSHECDFPESINHLPVCSEVAFADGLSSAEIDKKVKEILTDALSVYKVKRDIIRELEPDVVITQTQCEVCAVSLKDVKGALCNLLDKEAQIVSLEPHDLNGIFQNIKDVAAALNAQEQGEALLEQLQERVDIIRHKLKFVDSRPSVACIEWLEPLMISGNWVPEMVEIAGGKNVLGLPGKHSPFIQWDDIQLQDPDIIIVMPCGFSIERTMKEIDLLISRPAFSYLKAAQNNQIYIVDGNQYFNRSGPRIVDSIEILAEIIQPKFFSFGYEGEGWVKFSF